MPYSGFWEKLARPIIALSPMDGVTDFAFRYITARYGRPDVMFTEFTTAEGMFYAPERILQDFEYSEIERPIVAQIYGHRPDDFYRAAHVVCELGFDGIDINMGCPSKSVVQKNCGAKLITVPDLALEIIAATRRGVEDWAQGQTLEKLKISQRMVDTVSKMNRLRTGNDNPTMRRLIPYSVKTRIGYDSIVIEDWVKTLLSEKPAVISIHGRTLKQMYKGSAHWEAIGHAVQVAKGTGTLILGNGDIGSMEEAYQKIQNTGVDGVLIGRGSMGNPWIFEKSVRKISKQERFEIALEHARYYSEIRGDRDFRTIRKHLIYYLSNFPEAVSFRVKALQTKNLGELREVLR
jgi:nifR3 family TIM-barrel protein